MKVSYKSLIISISAISIVSCGGNSTNNQQNPSEPTSTVNSTESTQKNNSQIPVTSTTVTDNLKEQGVNYKLFSIGSCTIEQKGPGEKPIATCEVEETQDPDQADIAGFSKGEPPKDSGSLGLLCSAPVGSNACEGWPWRWTGGGTNRGGNKPGGQVCPTNKDKTANQDQDKTFDAEAHRKKLLEKKLAHAAQSVKESHDSAPSSNTESARESQIGWEDLASTFDRYDPSYDTEPDFGDYDTDFDGDVYNSEFDGYDYEY